MPDTCALQALPMDRWIDNKALHGPGGLQAGPGPGQSFDKRKQARLVQGAGPRTVGPPKAVLLKSNKLTIVTDKIKPFNLYVSNKYKYIVINNDSQYIHSNVHRIREHAYSFFYFLLLFVPLSALTSCLVTLFLYTLCFKKTGTLFVFAIILCVVHRS